MSLSISVNNKLDLLAKIKIFNVEESSYGIN